MKLFFRQEYVLGGHAFDTTRKAGWIAESLQDLPIGAIELASPSLLNESLLKAVHDSSYIAAIQTGEPRELAESQLFPWDENLWHMVLASNGGAVCAALDALKQRSISGSLSSGLHHAKRAQGAGYCTFNGLALAAHAALASGARRILIIDVDAHCGGGTAELVARYGTRVHHLDVSVDPYDRYTSQAPHTLDVITRANEYLPRLKARLDELPHDFDLCLYNAGMDPYEGCTEGGLHGITFGILAERERLVFEWRRRHDVPLAFVLAGGYTSDTLSRDDLIRLHRLTIETAATA